MGLFLAPFSGNAVGGGGHGVIDPPPPGMDPGGGPRSEVDTVGRSPLRLLRTTMNRHQPKFMNIVPPGQQRGSIAPPYTWDTLERSDWRYETPKRSPLRMGEGEFDAPKAVKPRPLAPKPVGPRPPAGRPAQGARPAGPKPGPAAPPKPTVHNDQRRARISQIQSEISQLRMEIQQLMARQKAAVAQAHQQAKTIGRQFNPDQQRRAESLSRSALRIIEADYTPFGIPRDPSDPEYPRHDSFAAPDPVMSPEERAGGERLRAIGRMGAPTGLRPQAPQASTAVLEIHRQIQAKRQRLVQLAQELRQLRQQAQGRLESVGLTTNNLRRLSLLLK